MDSDIILNILGNDTRRRILAVLSQEPMYFNQLAKEIAVGQQAVLRHLQSLEELGLVETYAEKSEHGAPDRKYYRLNTSFTLTITLSEDDFTIKKENLVASRQKESKKYYRGLDSITDDAGQALSSLQENMAEIEAEISNIESQLNDLRALKQLILHKMHEIGKDIFDENERRILYTIVEESPKSVAELSAMLDKKESSLKRIITGMKEKMKEGSAKTLFDLQ
jgi:predicted transcriptional regulator